MDAFTTLELAPQLICAPRPSLPQPVAHSPVFDFDQEWAQHVTALRSTTKMSSMGSPTDAESVMMELQYDGTSAPQSAQWTPAASAHPQTWDGAFWGEEQWSGVRQYYGAYSTSPHMSSSNSFPSSASSSTLRSPTTSRGSKRSSAEMSPASSKRRRVGSLSQDQSCKRGGFYLNDGEEDEESEFQGPWEIVQGAWDVSIVSPDMPPQIAPVIRVREMPKLREPAPRPPPQVWEAFKILH